MSPLGAGVSPAGLFRRRLINDDDARQSTVGVDPTCRTVAGARLGRAPTCKHDVIECETKSMTDVSRTSRLSRSH